MNAVATIGHNSPPDPFEGFRLHIEDLFEQAQQFLDGTGIQNQAQADDVSALLNMVRKSSNDADEQRKAEKKPFDDGAKAVQAKWKPLLDKLDLAAFTAKNALAPFLRKQEEEARAKAEELRLEAERQAKAVRDAHAKAAADDLAAQASMREMEKASERAQRDASKAAKVRPQAKGGERAVSLRTSYRAEIIDPLALGKWAWENRRDEYLAFLTDLAERESRQGPKGIPGITVHTERNAV